jgi:hypothetical protein
MKPNRFIAFSERRLGRALTAAEIKAVNDARACATGRRETISAMRAALDHFTKSSN